MKPVANMDWPPRAAQITRSLQEWDAWYTGSATKLSRTYSATTTRPSQYAGGLVGWGSRMLWGRPTPPKGEQDHRIHLPLAADIASASSDLLFGEELQIDWDPDNSTPLGPDGVPLKSPETTRMDYILDGIGWQSLLGEAGELASALGGVYLRAAWDEDTADHVLAGLVHADGAIPTFSFGILREVTFWEVLSDQSNVVYRHLETQEPGRITHQLWKGSRDKLGNIVPLAEHPATAALADVLDGPDFIGTGIDQLAVVYVPNIKPVAVWRHLPEAKYLGRSDFGALGVVGLFDAIDETWSSWMRDIRHGKSRIMAASSALQTNATNPGQGAWFDFDSEVYERFMIAAGEDPSIDKMISAQQFQIRAADHAQTIRELTLAAVNSCGYSGSTFGLDSEVAKTATEVGAVRARTQSTREKKTRYWTPQLERFLGVLADLDAAKFGSPTKGLRPKVSFPAFSTPGMLELAQTAQALKAAQAASTKTLVQLVHPDWTEGQIDEEVALISDETAPEPVMVGDPFAPDASSAQDLPPELA